MLSCRVPHWMNVNAFGCMLWALGALLGTQSLARAQNIQEARRTGQPAQEARVFGDSDKLAISQMYDRYVQAFVKKDYTTLREYVQAPFVVLTGGEMQTLESVDAVLTVYRNIRELLEQRNYDHTEVFRTRITPLTADSALINMAYRRYKKDGSLLEEGAAVYPVIKSSGVWKLRGLVLQELQYFGKVY